MKATERLPGQNVSIDRNTKYQTKDQSITIWSGLESFVTGWCS
jgi:hypothetical protein